MQIIIKNELGMTGGVVTERGTYEYLDNMSEKRNESGSERDILKRRNTVVVIGLSAP